ncbi:hypothetical protein N7504_007637 [Penicillium tannophilum]|nr:hypothetical protein N7504_007637 [Penicillium tannophilum]
MSHLKGVLFTPERATDRREAIITLRKALEVPPLKKNGKLAEFSTKLYDAIQQKDPEKMKVQLDAIANVKGRTINFANALAFGAAVGDPDSVALLLEAGGDVNLNIPLKFHYGSALAVASYFGKVEVAHLLIVAGANVNLVLEYGNFGSALVAASGGGKWEAVEYLLSVGADVNLQVRYGRFETALSAALSQGDLSMARHLIDAGANVDLPLQRALRGSTLISACVDGKVEIVRLLLDAGANVDLQVTIGYYGSALVAAAECGNIEIIQLLLSAGAIVNQQVKHGEHGSALVASSMSGQTKATQILLEAGADPNLRLKYGRHGSALAAACFHLGAEIVPLLLDAGADPSLPLLRGSYGDAVSVAVHKENYRALQYLVKENANLGPLTTDLIDRTRFFDLKAGTYPLTKYDFGRGVILRSSFNSEIPTMPGFHRDPVSWLFSKDALIRTEDTMKFVTIQNFLQSSYGTLGVDLLRGIARAWQNPQRFWMDGNMKLQMFSENITMECSSSTPELLYMLRWICSTIRRPVLGSVSFSTSKNVGYNFKLEDLQPLPQLPEDNNCWRGLFETAVVSMEPNITHQKPCRGLELDFNIMVQLAAVEYPVLVEHGLVLMGFSTALIPICETEDGVVLWHLETSSSEFQLKTRDLKATQQEWLRTEKLDYLQSKKALLGWCTEANILLGTNQLPANVTWSNAQKKPITWHWKGTNLQVIAQTASPLQLGGQAGMSFDRTINTLRFSPSRNYIKCLQSSAIEQIILYDVKAKRAWLVSLISVLHHMLLVYCNSLEENSQPNPAPTTLPSLNGSSASFKALKNMGGLVIQGTAEESLTIRELVMGFSVNLSRASLHKPKRSTIYGYEFMDIVMDSTRSELKKQQLNKSGLVWTSLLSEVNCLFCSDLGEAIVGSRGLNISSPCNSLPKGHDLMAASMQSIEKVSLKHGGKVEGEIRQISHSHCWKLTGSPFQRCQHDTPEDSCWDRPGLLQEIQILQPSNQPNGNGLAGYINGALVFGGQLKAIKTGMPTQSLTHESRPGVSNSVQQVHMEVNRMCPRH